MASHFSDIGIPIATMDDYREWAVFAANSGDQISFSRIVWRDPSGAQLWVQVEGGNILGFAPSFETENLIEVTVEEVFQSDEPGSDICVKAWVGEASAAEDGEASDQLGYYPFVFESPDSVKSLPYLPCKAWAKVVAFAHHLTVTDVHDEQETVDPTEEVHFADRHFVPSGLFTFQDGDVGVAPEPEAVALFGGAILSVEERKNQRTGLPFIVMLVGSLDADYVVVADPAVLEDIPKVGQILSGEFWMTGQLVEFSA